MYKSTKKKNQKGISMFKIEENQYIKNEMVKYIDEEGNKLMIIATKKFDVSEIRIKLRPVANINIPRIVLKFPFEEEGLNFHIDFKETATKEDEDYVNSEAFKQLLSEVKQLTEKWIDMWANVAILINNSMELSKENVELLLTKLESEEETEEFAKLYKGTLSAI